MSCWGRVGKSGKSGISHGKGVLSKLIPRFQQVFTPGKEIAVDESMIGYKGRLSFLQYMPKKPQKWGMKAWALADSNTGYIWNRKLYTGKGDDAEQGKLLGERVVLELTKNLWHKGYHLYFDNFYTSPSLCSKLFDYAY